MLESLTSSVIAIKLFLEQLLCRRVDGIVALGVDIVDVGPSGDEIEEYVLLCGNTGVSAF